MGHKDVRKGMTQSNFNEKNSNILFGEIFIIAIVVGIAMQSWWWFGGIFLGLITMLFIKPLAIVLMILLSACWGLIGYTIGAFFNSTGAMIILGLIGFLAGLGAHMSGLQWARDIAED